MRCVRVPLGAVSAVLLFGLVFAQPEPGPVPPDGQSDLMCLENLAPNPSFEEGLAGWFIARGPQGYVNIDTDVARTGGSSLRLEAPVAPEHVMLSSSHMPVNPWEPYRLHFFYKSDTSHVGPLFRIYPVETGGHLTPGRAQWIGCDGAEDWTGYYADFVFPEDIGDVQITFCAGHWVEGADRMGTCWIDDLEFGPAAALVPAGATDCSEASIIWNGGFELGCTGQAFSWPAAFLVGEAMYWTGFASVRHYLGADTEIIWDEEGPYLGDRCLHMQYMGQDPKHKVPVVRTLYPENGEAYDIRFFGKTDGADGRVVFEPYGEDNKWLFAACAVRVKQGDWQEHRLRYEPEERTPVPCGLKLSVVLYGPGNLWVDELEMVPAGMGFGRGDDEPEAKPPAAAVGAAQQAQAHLDRGRELKDQRRFAEAATELRAAIAGDPELLEAHRILAWVLVELKQEDGAAAEFCKVIELAPDSDQAKEAQKALERLGR